VFDTNVFVSALAIPGGRADEALARITAGTDELFVSKAIVAEVLDVLARKFGRDREELARVAVLLSELGQVVRTGRRIAVLDDDADNRLLECGIAARAEAIVTGDRAFLDLASYRGIWILTLRAYLDQSAG
jgi:uncharacterized protein